MNFDKSYYVYVLTDKPYGTLYVGVTNNLARRVFEHKEGAVEGFTKKYGLKNLVYYEVYSEIEQAIAREKKLKRWRRDWKIDLIHSMNRDWKDLTQQINQ